MKYTKENIAKLGLSLLIISLAFLLPRFWSFDYEKISHFGYAGVFLATLVGSSTIFFPAPNIPVIIAASVLFDPFWVGICGGIGWSMGEFTGYFAGRSGKILLSQEQQNKYAKSLQRWGPLMIFLMALIPNPVFDIVGILAGFFKISVLKFYLPCLCGKLIDGLILAYFGHFLVLLFN